MQDRFKAVGERAEKMKNRKSRPYAKKKLKKNSSKLTHLAGLPMFIRDLKHFDAEMAQKYSRKQLSQIMRLIFKKMTKKIIKDLWRMPFPCKIGSLYMSESQRSKYEVNKDGKIYKDGSLEALLRECQTGLKRVYLKWNKKGHRFSYQKVWQFKRSSGYFRSMLFDEVMECAQDATKVRYRGHID